MPLAHASQRQPNSMTPIQHVSRRRAHRLLSILVGVVCVITNVAGAEDFSLGRDFSAADNPAGVWSFGWKANLGGTYSNLTVRHTSPTGGVLIPS